LREQKHSVPIERVRHPPVEAPERVEHALGGDRFGEQRIERPWRGAIQHPADIGIGRDGGHAEQGLAVRPAVSLFQGALMAEEGGASHEEHRERREADIGHRVFAVAARPFAPVRQAGANAFQIGDQGLQGRHGAIESKIAPRRQAKSSHKMARGVKFRGLLHFRLAPDALASSCGRVSGGERVSRYETHSHLELLHR
jgi:hypothetical protein